MRSEVPPWTTDAPVVVGIDASPAAAAALRYAAEVARREGTRLVVCHAYLAPIAYVGSDAEIARIDPELHDAAHARLRRAVADAGAELAGVEITEVLHPGRAADGLLELASPARLLVVGARGAGGFQGSLLGSTAEHCARHCPRPLVVVPATPSPPEGRVVVGLDGSPASRAALAWASDEARRRGAELEAVSVYHPYDARGPFGGDFMQLASPGSTERFRRVAEEQLADATATVDGDVAVARTVVPGHPAQTLVEHAAGAALLVVGRRGSAAFRGFHLGSTARKVLHHTEIPVAVIPG
jgi:nucleotide-binding universal stress UspA family protein